MERQLWCADALDTTSDTDSLKYSFGMFQMQQHPEKIPLRRLSWNV